MRCSISDLSTEVRFTEQNDNEKTIKDYKVRISINRVSNAVLNAFLQGEDCFTLRLNKDLFSQECLDIKDIRYVINPNNN